MSKIIYLISLVFLINLVIAIPIYEGPNTIDSGLDYISNWWIINNDTYVNATQVSNSSINITIPLMSELNKTFSVRFEGYKNEEEKIVYVSSGGSGGTKTKYVYRNNTEYIIFERNKTKEIVVDNPIEVEKEIGKIPLWFWILSGILILGIIVLGVLVLQKENLIKKMELIRE